MGSQAPYLAGPILGCSDAECKEWRREALDRFPYALNPLRRDYRQEEYTKTNEIVVLDKKDIRESDCLLVNYPYPSVGTAMEVFYAWTLGIPVVVVVGCKPSPWMLYHSTAQFASFEEAYAWIEEKI